MTTRRQSDLKRILESLNAICTKCGFKIHPSNVQRGADGAVICPKCGAAFTPAKKAS